MFEMQYKQGYRGWKSRKFKVRIEDKQVVLYDTKLEYNDPIYNKMVFAHDIVEHTFMDENYIGEVAAFGAIVNVRYRTGMMTDNQYKGFQEEIVTLYLSCEDRILRRCNKHPKHDYYLDLCNHEYFLHKMFYKDEFVKIAMQELEDEEIVEKWWSHVESHKQSILNSFVKGYANADIRYPGHKGEWLFTGLARLFDKLQEYSGELHDDQIIKVQWETDSCNSRIVFQQSSYNDDTDKETFYKEIIQ